SLRRDRSDRACRRRARCRRRRPRNRRRAAAWSALRLSFDPQRERHLLSTGGDRGLGQRLDRAGRARKRAVGLIELLRRVVKMPAELIVQLDETLELAAYSGDPLLQLARALLHRQTAHTERDDLQVREQGVRRRRYHMTPGAIRREIRLSLILAQHDVVEDGL